VPPSWYSPPYMPQSHNRYIVRASIEEVWKALTDPAIVKEYFYGTELQSDWKVGSKITFSGTWKGKKYVDKGVIKVIEAPHILKYTYRGSSSKLRDILKNYLMVVYSLREIMLGVTELTITQEHHDEDAAIDAARNWDSVMGAMIDLLEAKEISPIFKQDQLVAVE
jgi:uncharacterized protein YndB with AHSA1/START domain